MEIEQISKLVEVVNLLEKNGFHIDSASYENYPDSVSNTGAILLKITPKEKG